MSQPHGQCSSCSAGPDIGSVRSVRTRNALRLSTLATSILLAMTACGLGSLAMPEGNSRVERLPPRQQLAAGAMPLPSAEASPGDVLAMAANETMPSGLRPKAGSPASEIPLIAGSSMPQRERQTIRLAQEAVVAPDLVPIRIFGHVVPMPLQEHEKEGFHAYPLLCGGAAAIAMMWLIARHRRGRRRPPAGGRWVPVPWTATGAPKPHWDYAPELFDSDAFLSRWETIELCIHGDMELMAAIAGQWMPGNRSSELPAPRSLPPPVETAAPGWWCETVEEDHPDVPPGWRQPGLRVDGDPDLLAAIAGRTAPQEVMEGASRSAEGGAPETSAATEVSVSLVEGGSASAAQAPDVVACAADATAIGSDEQARVMTDESLIQDPAASPYRDLSDADLIARSQAWIGEMSRRGLSDAEAAWLLVQSLLARAGQRAAREAAVLREAAAKFAGWTANLAPMELRPAWRARWLDIQVSRLCTQKGAARLLGFRSLDADCAADGSPEVIEARLRLLRRWSEGLVGAAAKAKRAEADALAARLPPVPGEEPPLSAPVRRHSAS